MNIDPFFADILACPLCGASLEAQETSLKCHRCCKAFPIRDHIPFLIPEAAQPCEDQQAASA